MDRKEERGREKDGEREGVRGREGERERERSGDQVVLNNGGMR